MHASKDLTLNITVDKAINLIKGAGGIAVWAHPFNVTKDKATIKFLAKKLKKKGIKGIEINSSTHKLAKQKKFLLKLAKKHSLIPTAGTDHHNKEDKIGAIAQKELNTFSNEVMKKCK